MKMKNNVYTVILAGGKGTRLWPLSKKGVSKSFIEIAGKPPMISETVKRLQGLVDRNHIIFVVDKLQKKVLGRTIRGIPRRNILVEPFGRSTASAVGLASIQLDPESILVVLPTDAYVDNPSKFRQTIKHAVDFVGKKDKSLVCIGVPPKLATSAYGYIKVGKSAKQGIFQIDRFIEKPSTKKAERLLGRGGYLWNAGMFIFKAKTILDAITKHAPRLYKELNRIKKNKKSIVSAYSRMKNVSIDYQIMEKATEIYCVKAGFNWFDLGNWTSIGNLFKRDKRGNVSLGNVVLDNTSNTFVYNSVKHTVGVIGVENLVVIHNNNGVLVCNKKDAERVKKLGLV